MKADELHVDWMPVPAGGPARSAWSGILRAHGDVAWACQHDHQDRSGAEQCAVDELERLRAEERGDGEQAATTG
jgi:hypothetical protein